MSYPSPAPTQRRDDSPSLYSQDSLAQSEILPPVPYQASSDDLHSLLSAASGTQADSPVEGPFARGRRLLLEQALALNEQSLTAAASDDGRPAYAESIDSRILGGHRRRDSTWSFRAPSPSAIRFAPVESLHKISHTLSKARPSAELASTEPSRAAPGPPDITVSGTAMNFLPPGVEGVSSPLLFSIPSKLITIRTPHLWVG
jgi:hypothetical protein